MAGRATLTTVPSRAAMPEPTTVVATTHRAAGVPHRTCSVGAARPASTSRPPWDGAAEATGARVVAAALRCSHSAAEREPGRLVRFLTAGDPEGRPARGVWAPVEEQ